MADNVPSGTEYRAGRKESVSSTTSTTSTTTAPPYRRSSHALFETLQAQKRKDDPVSIARRQSLNEQRPVGGVVAQFWNR
ncbi:uncharacterized protein B0T15DRAFT_489194 [Chaetomium strumarium]|uniref:Uncharacterized protein n=1 Tax=Chaetomium strumarium TaxID=1170767 RepID=A0AAJ0M650_9PEZI|nr:hypothetical protein B0T15DRAFT_489194 [Chaetomium strumarium]